LIGILQLSDYVILRFRINVVRFRKSSVSQNFQELLDCSNHFLKGEAMQTELDLTIKDIADRAGLGVRMVNIYRASTEQRLGRKLGYKIGKTWHFRPGEVREILKSREEQAGSESNAGNSQNFREMPNFSQANNQAEDGIIGGMDAIVASGDQNAITIGQALGTRWNQLMWTAALQTMQGGMVTMSNQFEEMHQSVRLTLTDIDPKQLAGQPDPLLLDECDG
jgi:hypothetical protein